MFKWIFRVIGIIIILVVLLVLGTCAWQNCRGGASAPVVDLKPPSIEKAAYSVNITVTHNVFYSGKVDTVKNPNGDIIIMHGYWEVTKGKYEYHNITLSLNEAIFGNIEVKKR